MKFSEKIWFMILLKVTKKTGFHALSRKHIFEKTTGGDEPPAFLGLKRSSKCALS